MAEVHRLTLESGEEVTLTVIGPGEPLPFTITVTEGPTCPCCGGKEVLLGGPVRPYKVDCGRGWESHCTACDRWFIDGETKEEVDARYAA